MSAEQNGSELSGEGGGFTPITSQEQLDKVMADYMELAKRQGMPSDYDEVKAKAARLDEVEERSRSELKMANERAEKAEKEAASLRHAAEVGAWKAEVSAETGVPAAVLRGDTLEELREHAEAVRQSIPIYPQVSERGGAGGNPMSKADILAIEDPRERKAAILANLSQF